MLWKKDLETYIAVVEIREINRDRQLYGKREFEFILADKSKQTRTFEAEEASAWTASFRKGGQVINA